MRIRSLRLRNFRRHEDTRLEFPDGVTALIGANGAGKSSLLEGIAFALFGTDGLRTGKALVRRDGAPPGDAVEATLELELGGQALTLHRELRGKALTPGASLVVDGAVVVPAGAGSSDAVTQEVARRLGMGPDAFFTAVVARQGELARLANESPADRKRMVLRMVGVDRVDAAIERARERRRAAQAAVEALRRVARDPAQAEAAVAQAEAAEAGAQAAVARAQAAWDAARAELAAAQAELGRLEAEAATRRELVTAAEAARREAGHRAEAVARLQAELQLAAAARQAAEALRPAADRLAPLQAAWQEAQRAVALARQRAHQQQGIARLESELAAARSALARLPAPPPAEAAEAAEVALRMAETEVVAARARLAAARSALAQAQERQRRVHSLGEEAPCPTCERPLAGHLHQIAAHTHDAIRRADDEAAAAMAAEGQAAQRLAEARGRHQQALEAQRQRDRHALEARQLAARTEDLQARLAEAQQHLAPAAPPPEGVESLRDELAAAQRAHDERQRHAGLADRVPGLAALAAQAASAHAAALATLQGAERLLADAPDPTAGLSAARARAAAAQAQERVGERALHDAQRSWDAARQAAMHAHQQLAEQRHVAAELAAASAEAGEWTALTDGHGGGLLERFRDHVVDRIGPAIQAEASRLLSAFTGGRYTELLLDTSYDVYVTDGGVPYALQRFSGGEQDLAHLALRLAVSRLLAERAGGAELRFLALDEVFGSLDAQRRDLVVTALRGLGGLYSQVLVVSHQDALQEALDQAVLVLPDGSTNRVLVHNG